ncbi:uncharacterized protein [Montipora foliosa]|uniref:uncharacterized protein isoform X2 n=1 Tax=Montipora foliosa TaxID=591990 RepID=UPI0035F2029C
MTKGFLSCNGIEVAEKRIASSLARVNPANHCQRQDRTEQLTNPIPYAAEYFGHKLHIDQNEKLVMYGVVHVCAIDGQSVLTYGMWDQLRVDKGKEFSLMLSVQHLLRQHRRNTTRLPYQQTTSKQNHRIERVWLEMNLRVNYPIKKALNLMVNSELFNLEDEVTKFAVSWVTLQVCQAGSRVVIDSWNAHYVTGLCLVKHESAYKYTAKNSNNDGSTDYGIFQLNDRYWCGRGSTKYSKCWQINTYGCGVDVCNDFLNSNIADDTSCAVKIKTCNSFSKWYAWIKHCKGKNLSSKSEYDFSNC